MKRPALVLLLLSAALFSARTADAETFAFNFRDVLSAVHGTIPVPPEWDGIWTVQDSIYECTGALITVVASVDTICSGQVVYEPPPDTPIIFDCTGTADANSIDVTCTGSMEVAPDCQASFVVEIDGTRTGNTSRTVIVSNVSYSGTGEGCDLIPDTCIRIVTESTRTGPAPTDYCMSPTLPTTWGKNKAQYR